jgi:hypothetical protein
MFAYDQLMQSVFDKNSLSTEEKRCVEYSVGAKFAADAILAKSVLSLHDVVPLTEKAVKVLKKERKKRWFSR